jgi:hypothetical protein
VTSARISDLHEFYGLLGLLAESVGGPRILDACSGRLGWPQRGVYFFMEDGELRTHSGSGPRIIRVGTHALTQGSGTKLWGRLKQHRGQHSTGGGNHRGSIFRLLVGTAIMARNGHDFPTWGDRRTAPADVRAAENALEREVSKAICAMPFLWLAINDEPGAESLRGYIERNSIALLSNFEKEPLDPPSVGWLGHFCDRELVRKSGLWNQRHVDEPYDRAFVRRLARLVSEMGRGT